MQLHPRRLYALLFETVWATLSAFGADPKRLDGELGMSAVLHTLISRLRRAIADGRLDALGERDSIDALMAADGVVYAKPCLTPAETVVDSLGRYSHRIALSEARIRGVEDDEVRLDSKDYRDGNRRQVLTLSGEERIRRLSRARPAQGLYAHPPRPESVIGHSTSYELDQIRLAGRPLIAQECRQTLQGIDRLVLQGIRQGGDGVALVGVVVHGGQASGECNRLCAVACPGTAPCASLLFSGRGHPVRNRSGWTSQALMASCNPARWAR